MTPTVISILLHLVLTKDLGFKTFMAKASHKHHEAYLLKMGFTKDETTHIFTKTI